MSFAKGQPICEGCLRGLYSLHRTMREYPSVAKVCCICGNTTTDGYHVRLDPLKIKYPHVAVKRKKNRAY